MDTILKQIGDRTKLIFVDFHAEATAEKVSMGWYLDGKVSALMGTHTHIQTADAQIFPRGMAYISDVGMSGSYNSVLGMDKDIAIKRFLLQTAHKFELAEGDFKVSGACVTIDSTTGLAEEISPFVYPEFVNKAVY
jgi:calcineurin-like phosphoesterase